MGRGKKKPLVAVVLTTLLTLSCMVPAYAETKAAADSADASDAMPTALVSSKAVKVSRVTGATPEGENLPNPTPTTAQDLYATDLGIMWDDGNGKIMTVFGDSYDQGWGGFGGGGTGWRSNVLGLSSDTELSDGLSFDSMITDEDGNVKEIISSAHDVSGNGDFTAIPTAGVSVGTRNFIHYMQIKKWGDAGRWTTNFSELAYSDDEGQTWTKSGVKWSGSSKFAQAGYAKDGGYVYMLGTPSGRFGGMYLARAAEADMLAKDKYQYWDGSEWVTDNEAAAALIVDAPVGEFSVAYNSYYHKWIMCYLDENRAAIVLRSSSTLTGPWSAETVVASGKQFPGLYGGFIHPWTNDGPDLYFTMSQWGPYNVFLMHATLSLGNPAENLVSDPGFEHQPSGTVSAPWAIEGSGGIDRNPDNILSRSGFNNVWLRSASGWNAVKQNVQVAPNTQYKLTAFVRNSNNNVNGYFGVRAADGVTVLKETPFAGLANYTPVSVNFNSGDNTSVQIFTGMWANGDTWVQVDDYSLFPVDSIPPVITLKGDASIEIPLGAAYTDPGATAADNADGDLTDKIVVSGEVNTHIIGTYTLTYNVSDSEENAAVPVTRTVKVTGQDYTISHVVFKNSNGEAVDTLHAKDFISASADIMNNTASANPVTMVVTLYDRKGSVQNQSAVTTAIASGSTQTFTAGFSLPSSTNGSYVEVTVWDSLAGKHPLADPVTLNANKPGNSGNGSK